MEIIAVFQYERLLFEAASLFLIKDEFNFIFGTVWKIIYIIAFA